MVLNISDERQKCHWYVQQLWILQQTLRQRLQSIFVACQGDPRCDQQRISLACCDQQGICVEQKPFPSCEVSGFWLCYQSHVRACPGLRPAQTWNICGFTTACYFCIGLLWLSGLLWFPYVSLLWFLLWFPHSWRQCIAASLKRIFRHLRWISLNDVPIAKGDKYYFFLNVYNML